LYNIEDMIVSEADAAMMKSYGTYAVAERFVQPLLNVLGGSVVQGVENLRPLDGQGYFVAPNHQSNWDHFFLGQAMLDLPDLSQRQQPDLEPLQPRGLHWMAKDSLWLYPVIREFVELCNAFPVERGTGKGLPEHLVNYIGNLMDNDAVLVMYPEGHREKTLAQANFKSTVAYLALKYGKPIVPVGLAGPLKGPKFPRAAVFEKAIFPAQMDPKDPAFKTAKDDLMDEVYLSVSSGFQKANYLYPQLEPQPGLVRSLNELTGSPAGKLAVATVAGLAWKFAGEIRRDRQRS
jgi:1-acyl-sn-glycerol-3-phosphate acyltransferase